MNGGKSAFKTKGGSQVQRFRDVAKMIGADKSEAAFDRALRKVASAPPAPMPKAKKAKKKR